MTRCSLIISIILAGLVAAGCSNNEKKAAPAGASSAVPITALFEHSVVVPTSVLTFELSGSERLSASQVRVQFAGTLEGGDDLSYTYEADVAQLEAPDGDAPSDTPQPVPGGVRRAEGDTGPLIIGVPVEQGLWQAVALTGDTRQFEGTITVTVADAFGEDVARAVVEDASLTFQARIVPQASDAPTGDVYLDERVALTGSGFLRPEEGDTIAEITSGAITYEDGTSRDVSGARVVVVWGGARDRASFVLDPTVLGVRPGEFSGDVRFVNELRDGSTFEGAQLSGANLSIQRSYISTLACGDKDPCPGGSRGQLIAVQGRGLVATRGGVSMTLLFEGEFTPDDPDQAPLDLTGVNALERSITTYVNDQRVELGVWYSIVNDGAVRPYLTGLGATPGTYEGTITPIIRDGAGEEQRGISWQGSFDVLPTKQVVYLKYLPRFSSGLEKYGLRNVEAEIRAKILAAAQAPYAEYNVVFTDTRPTDFLDYATIELSGPDPYGRNAFGYDNSFNDTAKDTDNLYLSDYIGGWSSGSATEFDNPFGGIYIESFDYYSPTISAKRNDGNPVEDASEDFDRILGPFMPELGGAPVRGAEWPDGDRAAQIQEAIDMVGNVIGNTVAHEVGHSMGLAFEPGDRERPGGVFHNQAPSDGALMDSGAWRPFDERANINGVEAATFNGINAEYLGEILPKP